MIDTHATRAKLDELRREVREDGSGEALLTRAEQMEIDRHIDRLYEIIHHAKGRKPQMALTF